MCRGESSPGKKTLIGYPMLSPEITLYRRSRLKLCMCMCVGSVTKVINLREQEGIHVREERRR